MHCDRLVQLLVFHDVEDRGEGLALDQFRRTRHFNQCWARVIATLARHLDALAARHCAAGLFGLGERLLHCRESALVDERSDLRVRVGPAAELELAHPLGELLGELGRDRLVHVEAVGRRARLADVAHLGDHRPFDGGVDVGVVEDQERRVAA